MFVGCVALFYQPRWGWCSVLVLLLSRLYLSLSLCGGDCQRYVVSRPSLPVNVSDSLNEACFQQLEDLLIRDISGRNLIVYLT